MSKQVKQDRNVPFNNLPLLPPPTEKIKDMDILDKLVEAKHALGLLEGSVQRLPNPQMLINTLSLREAKDSSEIENIFTSHDELYKAMSVDSVKMPSDTKEVLKYREALEMGFQIMQDKEEMDMETIIAIYQTIQETQRGIRSDLSDTTIKKGSSEFGSGDVIYTPPRGKKIIEEKMENWLEFYNNDKDYPVDPLIKLAITHYQFEAIHPFDDGNGRVGRILNVLILNQKGLLRYPILYLSAYIIENKDEYYHLLAGVTQRYSWKPWIMFILEAIEKTSKYTIELIEKIINLQDRIRIHILENQANFNTTIIGLLFFQPYIKATHIVNTPECGIKDRGTATSKLDKLEELEVVEKKIIGKETVYINYHLIQLLKDN